VRNQREALNHEDDEERHNYHSSRKEE